MSQNAKKPKGPKPIELYQAEAEKFLEDKGVEVGGTKIEKIDRGKPESVKSMKIRTNMFNLMVETVKPIYKYEVKIIGVTEDDKVIDFTGSTGCEFFALERLEVCSKIFDALFELDSPTFASRSQFYYNLRESLYSINKLEKEKYELEFSVEEAFGEELEVVFMVKLRRAQRFVVAINLGGEPLNTELVELMASNDLSEPESEVVRFFEVATWQDAIETPAEHVIFPKGRSYFMNPQNHGYRADDTITYPNFGIYLAIGLSKSAKMIEGENGRGVSIIVEPKLRLLHGGANLVEKFRPLIEAGNVNPKQMDEIVRGLYFIPVHLFDKPENKQIRMFKIHGLGNSATKQTFVLDDVEITVADYFKQKYAPLEYPDLPLIVVVRNKVESYYPMEHAELFDNQVVTRPSPELISDLIRKAAVLPNVLQERIQNSFNSLTLDNSDFMKNAGIVIDQKPMELEVPILTAPNMQYAASRSSAFDESRSSWKTGGMRFVAPMGLDNWCAFVAINNRGRRPLFSRENFSSFLKAYVNACHEKGVNTGDFQEARDSIILKETTLYENLRDALEYAKTNNYKFALVITDAADKEVHSCLKAYEQQIGIVTQNVTFRTANAAAGIGIPPRRLTMENIVNKTNMKIGGLNYNVINQNRSLGMTDLFLGFTLNHLAAGMGNLNQTVVPSILGYSANDSKEPIAFSGDFIYNKPLHQGFLPAIAQSVDTVFKRFLVNRQKEPERVIVYRGGCSDGEMKYVMKYEIPLLRKAIGNHFKGKPKLIFIVVGKLHNARFTPSQISSKQAKAFEQNIPPGIVIDRNVVQPIPEFYLGSHRAIQGTAKIPRYNILCNDADATLAEIEKITYDLCFCHQIINSSISIPSPVYCAEMNAKRGRNLFNSSVNREFISQNKRELGLDIDPESDEESEAIYMENKAVHARVLTKKLAYEQLPIRGQRFNA